VSDKSSLASWHDALHAMLRRGCGSLTWQKWRPVATIGSLTSFNRRLQRRYSTCSTPSPAVSSTTAATSASLPALSTWCLVCVPVYFRPASPTADDRVSCQGTEGTRWHYQAAACRPDLRTTRRHAPHSGPGAKRLGGQGPTLARGLAPGTMRISVNPEASEPGHGRRGAHDRQELGRCVTGGGAHRGGQINVGSERARPAFIGLRP
jgi:hypothetical protein